MSVARRGPSPPPQRSDGDAVFLRYWLFWVTLGASVGFLAPALVQVLFAGSPVRIPALITAGALEGTVLGWTQANVLRVRVPAVSRARWVGTTAIGAAVAWFVVLLPAEWADVWQRWPETGQVLAGLVAGAVLLTAIGIAQWTELRRHSRAAAWWIVGSAAAWCAGVAVFVSVATLLRQPGQPAALVLLIGALAGILLALTTALVGGAVLLRILGAGGPRQPV